MRTRVMEKPMHFRVSVSRPHRRVSIFPAWVFVAPVAPVANQVILEPGIGQFRGFESPRVHIIRRDSFLCTN